MDVCTRSAGALDDEAPGPRRILVIDDEPSIVDAVATALRYEGFAVVEATTGREGLALAQTAAPDLVVLDVMLPDFDGFEVARRIRADGLTTPVLFLTARDALEDKIAGFSSGADDYVTKPFSLAEIVLRVGRSSSARSAQPSNATRLMFADVVLDQDSHQVWRGGEPVELTATEFSLLRLFLLNPRPGALQTADPRPRLALRLRRRLEHPRDLHQLCPQEAQPARAAVDPHRPAGRLCAATATPTADVLSTICTMTLRTRLVASVGASRSSPSRSPV